MREAAPNHNHGPHYQAGGRRQHYRPNIAPHIGLSVQKIAAPEDVQCYGACENYEAEYLRLGCIPIKGADGGLDGQMHFCIKIGTNTDDKVNNKCLHIISQHRYLPASQDEYFSMMIHMIIILPVCQKNGHMVILGHCML